MKHYEPLVRDCLQLDPSVRPSMLEVDVLLSGTCFDHEHRTSADWNRALVEAPGASTSNQHSQVSTSRDEKQDDEASHGEELHSATLHQGFAPTPLQTQATVVLSALMCCNFEMPEAGFCCATHLAVKTAQEVLKTLERKPCTSGWASPAGQCIACGALEPDLDSYDQNPHCSCCGGQLQAQM